MNETKLLNLAFKLGRLWVQWTDFANSTPDARWNDLDIRDKREDFKNEIDDAVKEIGQWVRDYDASGTIPLNTYHDVKTGEIVAWKKEGPEDQLLKIRQAFKDFESAMDESGGDYAYAPDWEQVRPTTLKAIAALEKAIEGES